MDHRSALMCIIVIVSVKAELSRTPPCNNTSNKVVKLCHATYNIDSNAVYLYTAGAQFFMNSTCLCTLEATQNSSASRLGIVVTPTNVSPDDIPLEVDGMKISTINFIWVDYKPTMQIQYLTTSTNNVALLCFRFQGSPGITSVSIRCMSAETTTTPISTLNGTAAPTSPECGDCATGTTTSLTTTAVKANITTLPPKTTTKSTATVSGTDELQDDPKGTNIGIIGAAAGTAVVIVIIVVVTVVIYRKRASKRLKDLERKTDPDKNDAHYDMTINAGYVSVDACQRENNQDVQHDPKGYALVNKPKPAHKPNHSSRGGTEYAEYNHLNDILDKHTSDNIYNTATGNVENADTGDYNRVDDVSHNRTPDNLYNTATAGVTSVDVDMGDYEVQKQNVADNVYNVANAAGNTDSVYC